MVTGEDRVNVGVLTPYAGGPSPTPQSKAGPCPRNIRDVAGQPAEFENDSNSGRVSSFSGWDIDAFGDNSDSKCDNGDFVVHDYSTSNFGVPA